MTNCDLEKVDAKDLPIGKLIGILAKAQSIYFNNMLSELDINITQLHILFEVAGDSTLNQEKIASRCNTAFWNDRASRRDQYCNKKH